MRFSIVLPLKPILNERLWQLVSFGGNNITNMSISYQIKCVCGEFFFITLILSKWKPGRRSIKSDDLELEDRVKPTRRTGTGGSIPNVSGAPQTE